MTEIKPGDYVVYMRRTGAKPGDLTPSAKPMRVVALRPEGKIRLHQPDVPGQAITFKDVKLERVRKVEAP